MLDGGHTPRPLQQLDRLQASAVNGTKKFEGKNLFIPH
jgi:hypothetical protein